MSFDPLDPNRYAAGEEAALVLARARIEQADVQVATERLDHAQEALRVAEQRFHEAEAAYKLCTAAREVALSYKSLAVDQLDTSVSRLALVKAPLHPVRKAPLEVLGHIFVSCLDFYPPSGSSNLPDNAADILLRQKHPFHLAAVCRRWRQASHSYAPAWSTLDLRVDEITPGNVQHWVVFVNTIINHSAQVPMHLRFYRDRPMVPAVDNTVASLLCPLMVRCKALCMSMSALNDDADIFTSMLACPTPLMDGLQLNLAAPLRNLRDILPHAPNLREVWTNQPFTDGTRTFPKAILVTFQSAVTAEVLRRDDLAILQKACPELVDVTLVRPHFRPCVRLEPCVLNIPRLNLAYARADGDLLEFASQFSLPRIRSLKLYGHEDGSRARIAFLCAVLPEWKTLNRLVISTIVAADFDGFCGALACGASLGSLTIRKVDFTHDSLRKLCDALGRPQGDGGAWVCPLLKSLEFSACTLARDCVGDDLVQLVARRLAAFDKTADERRPARLRTVRLPSTSEIGLVARVRDLLSHNDE